MDRHNVKLALALAALMAPPLANGIDLIKEGAVFKYHKGTKEASSPRTSWTKINFSDTTWLSGQIPFYNNEDIDGGTELSDMNDRYTTVYLRRKFRVSDPSNLSTGTFEVRADDGYVAWLNGVEIANLNKPTSTLRYSSKSTKSNSEPIMWHKTTLQNIGGIVEKGWNVLSIMLLNSTSTSDVSELFTEADKVYYIETEDFNYDGGSFKTFEEVGTGGAYEGLGAVSGIDFNNRGNASQKYRVISRNHPGMTESMWDAERSGFNMEVDFKMGWQDNGDWYNYTRDFPEGGSYAVYGRFSSGGSPVNNKLSIVTSDATAADQTVEDVGTFTGPATGGWDTMKFFPLNDSNGELAIVDLSGTSTVRLTKVGGNMDANYLAFVQQDGTYLDAFLDVRLTAREREFVPPEIVSISPKPGEVTELNAIAVTFSEPMSGVDAVDLMINDYPAMGLRKNGNTFTFQFEQPAVGKIDVWWASGHGMGDQAIPPNAFSAEEGSWNDEATWSYELLDLVPPSLASRMPGEGTVRHFNQVELWFDKPVQGIDATDLMVNGVTAEAMTGIGAGPYVFEFDEVEAGQVEFSWADGHSITDLNKTPNEFHGQAWMIQVDPEYSPKILISEFVASNNASLTDEDGDTPDWIEIFNAGEAPVNLENWHLTNDPESPGKWRFPAVTIQPEGFIVIFASYKDRRDPSGPLHANFSLGAEGEYLALIQPDGTTVEHPFDPNYPEQFRDFSYGIGQNVVRQNLVTLDDSGTYLVPGNGDLKDTWIDPDFDDATWRLAVQPVGYQSSVPGFQVRNIKSSTAVTNLNRAETVISSPGLQSSVTTVIAPQLNYVGTGGGAHYSNNQPFPGASVGRDIDDFVIEATGTITIPSAGNWTFGVNSDDGFGLDIGDQRLAFPGPRGPTDSLATFQFAKAGDYELRLVYYERGGGASLEFWAAKGSRSSWTRNLFRLVGDTENGGLAVRTTPTSDDAPNAHAAGFAFETDLASDLKDYNASVYLRFPFQVADGAQFNVLELSTFYNDGFIAYLNGEEVVRRNAPENPSWNTTATSARSASDSIVLENSRLPGATSLLKPGKNVLAIHAFNASVSDINFLFAAELNDIKVENDATRYFSTPTPGEANGEGFFAFVGDTRFSQDRGFYEEPFELMITTATENAQIRFTTNGLPPTENTGQIYKSPIRIEKTTVLRAAAFKDGFEPSNVDTQTYLFLKDVIRQTFTTATEDGWPRNWGSNALDYGMDPDVVKSSKYRNTIIEDLKTIPSFSIVMNLKDLFDRNGGIYANPGQDGRDWERPASVELIDPDGEDEFQIDAGIRIRGGFSRSTQNPKHAFRLFFREEYGEAKLRYPLFGNNGADTFDNIDLRTFQNYSWSFQGDNRGIFIRDQFNRDAQLAMGHQGERGEFYHLYINGYYWGLYNTCERPEASYGETYFGGSKDDYDVIKVDTNQGYTAAATDGNIDAWRDLWTQAKAGLASDAACQRVQGNNPDGTPNLDYPVLIDIPNLIDYMLIILYGGNLDAPISNFIRNNNPNNFFSIRNRNQREGFKSFVHDAEHTLLNVNQDRTGPWPAGNQFPQSNPQWIWQQLSANAEFRLQVADHVHRHFFNGGVLSVEGATALFEKRIAQIDRAVVGESARWGDAKRGAPFTRDNAWLPEVNNVRKNYLPRRSEIVFKQLRNDNLYPSLAAPEYNQHGGTVSDGFKLKMSATSGDIYYTTNGSDPRVRFAGSVSPRAKKYDSAKGVILNDNAHLKARTMNAGKWSALTEATFTVRNESHPIRFSEIMYNPQGGDAFEFLELQNVGDTEVDLSGFSFDGITFRFAEDSAPLDAGMYLLLVNDANVEAFRARYPGVRVGGLYEGSLSNKGERLALIDRNGETVLSVDYNDGGTWPSEPDGDGYSLVLSNPNGDPDSPANWRTSSAKGGTPGRSSSSSPQPLVILNEVLAENVGSVENGATFPDYVELKNVAGTDVHLQNWSLSDNLGNPLKFNFPAGTVIPSNGYLVVWLDDAAEASGLHTGFALDNDGDTIALFNPEGERIDVLGFGLQVADHSIGRGSDDGAWSLNQPTPGKANKAAPVADLKNLKLNEFVAAAPPGGDDWIELYNTDSKPVALFGLMWEVSLAKFTYRNLSFIAPESYQVFQADKNPGVQHLDLRLPAGGGTILLRDSNGAELDDVSYSTQEDGESRGRYPNGNGSWKSFTSTVSPGQANYLLEIEGPKLNEIMAINDLVVIDPLGRTSDWIEIWNNSTKPADFTGMSLSVDGIEPGQWSFPDGTKLQADGLLLVWCNGSRDPELGPSDYLNTGRSLSGTHGTVYLFNTDEQIVDSVNYGFQVSDLSIGRDNSGNWTLLSSSTPGKENKTSSMLASTTNLVINEWMANGRNGDWIEFYNPQTMPVRLGGMYLTDDLSLVGRTKFEIPELNYIAAGGFVKWIADGDLGKGSDHVNFSLASLGEPIALYSRAKSLVDKFEISQTALGESEGRLPDGASRIVTFPTTPTPGKSNYLPVQNVVINEVLTHSDPPYEDAIELLNLSAESLNISNWWISNTKSNLKKYQIPSDTTLPPRGTTVFYEGQFNPAPGADHSFALNSAHGGTVIVSQTDSSGQLNGYRAIAEYDASENGVSFGRVESSIGDQFVTLAKPTFGVVNPSSLAAFRQGNGAINAAVKIGPVVIHEIMYHPAPLPLGAGTPDDEFIELRNITNATVPLYDPLHPENTWRIDGGAAFEFPSDFKLPPGGYVVLIEFNPATNPDKAASLAKRHGIPEDVPILGPLRGQLANSGDTVSLYKPDPPQGLQHDDAGFVPYILVDKVTFHDTAPWPSEADGLGATLQRTSGSAFANDPINWKAAAPNPGRANRPPTFDDTDLDGMPDEWETAFGLDPGNNADAASDADGDGLANLGEYLAGTDPGDASSALRLAAEGLANSKLRLVFEALPGRLFEIQSTPTLGQAAWKSILEVDVKTGGPQQVEVDLPDGEAQFFRLLLVE